MEESLNKKIRLNRESSEQKKKSLQVQLNAQLWSVIVPLAVDLVAWYYVTRLYFFLNL